MNDYKRVIMANEVVVRDICEHLIDSLEKYLEQKVEEIGEVKYLDVFMGVSNFHKAVIIDQVKRGEPDILYRAASDTFTMQMERAKETGR